MKNLKINEINELLKKLGLDYSIQTGGFFIDQNLSGLKLKDNKLFVNEEEIKIKRYNDFIKALKNTQSNLQTTLFK